ncbi:unnamed protein product [Spodoptera littoralis]|uniref:Uncharacterized protein n=1 Tax=Spodoptera littoralis TaxID=7109 RepID=A0A9P0N947_SPOLI|nr:unnamed protein product [Spodoptera littoralis]CAH1645910.1 unnamed protein product [Spodoptera littoralis]
MVNYRRVVCEVALVAVLVAVVRAAPAPDCATKHYDQRQNGTENYRLNIDGVVIAVAPAESLLSALGDMDDLLDLAMDEYHNEYKPKPPQSSSSSEPAIQVVSLPVPEEKPQKIKPQEEEKPSEADKPQEVKPEEPVKPAEPVSSLSDVSLDSDLKIQKKDVSLRKQEKAQRLKHRLASFLMPLLRKTRPH